MLGRLDARRSVTALNGMTELVDEEGCEDRREGGSHKKVKHVALSQDGDEPRQPADCEATVEDTRTDAAPAIEDVGSALRTRRTLTMA